MPDKRVGENVSAQRKEQVKKATKERNNNKDSKARAAGWGSWRKFETAVLNGIVELPQNPNQ